MKSIFSIFVTAVMLLSALTGCGTRTKNKTNDAARVTPSPAVTATARPEASAEPGDMEDDVKGALDDAGNAVGDVAKGAGDAVGDVAGAAGAAVNDAANGVGNAVEDMVDGVADAANGDTAAKDRNSGTSAARGGK